MNEFSLPNKILQFHAGLFASEQENKLNWICRTQSTGTIPMKHFPESPEKYVTNLSDSHLNKLQNEALSLGFKYSVPPGKIGRLDI